MTDINKALVVGAGTMGAGIAEVLAKAGVATALFDIEAAQTEKGIAQIRASLAKAVQRGKLDDDAAERAQALVSPTTDDARAVDVQLIVEAAPENLALKQKIFKGISEKNADAILATNTSSLSVSAIASAAVNPGRVIGLHFFNPVPIMPLVEIVTAEQTNETTVASAREIVARIKKESIVVRDAPGFASSRLGLILGIEAMRMLEAKVASAEDIDRAMELGYRHPMGPLRLTDLVGLDVRLAIAEHLEKEIGAQFQPPQILRDRVAAGKLGKKTGEGFYRWDKQ